MHAEDMVTRLGTEVIKLEAENGKLRRALEYCKGRLRSAQQRNRRAEGLIAIYVAEEEERAKQSFKVGDAQRFFSVRGGFSLALRRAVSGASCQSLGLAMALDVHRTTVARWEINFRAARVATMRSFLFDSYMQLAMAEDEDDDSDGDVNSTNTWTVALHFMRCDATNSGMWKKTHKLHSLLLHAVFVTKLIRQDASMAEVNRSLVERHMMATLQISKYGTGCGALGMMHKQICSLGCRMGGPVPLALLPPTLQSLRDKAIKAKQIVASAPEITFGPHVANPLTALGITKDASDSQDSVPMLCDGEPVIDGAVPVVELDKLESAEVAASKSDLELLIDDDCEPEVDSKVDLDVLDDLDPDVLVQALEARTSNDPPQGHASKRREEEKRIELDRCINIFVVTTDAGSDELKARKLKPIYSMENLKHWEVSCDCFAHQYQLLVLKVLVWLDWFLGTVLGFESKFYSTLAKICHCWRDRSSDAYLAFCDAYGATAAADALMNKVPPRALVGRWGAIAVCLGRLLKVGLPRLANVFKQVSSQTLEGGGRRC